jgi:hypothetical protein
MPGPGLSTLYQLRCVTCDKCASVVTDKPGSLLFPDLDEVAKEAGERNARFLEEFHRDHRGHEVKEEKID